MRWRSTSRASSRRSAWAPPRPTTAASRRCWPSCAAEPPRRRLATGSSGPAAQHDRLRLRVEVERLLAVLLAVAAGLPAAERQLVVDFGARVDPGVAGLD